MYSKITQKKQLTVNSYSGSQKEEVRSWALALLVWLYKLSVIPHLFEKGYNLLTVNCSQQLSD
jgi:hypothetical protein